MELIKFIHRYKVQTKWMRMNIKSILSFLQLTLFSWMNKWIRWSFLGFIAEMSSYKSVFLINRHGKKHKFNRFQVCASSNCAYRNGIMLAGFCSSYICSPFHVHRFEFYVCFFFLSFEIHTQLFFLTYFHFIRQSSLLFDKVLSSFIC